MTVRACTAHIARIVSNEGRIARRKSVVNGKLR